MAANAKVLVPWHDAVDILGFDMYNGIKDSGLVPPATVEPPSVRVLAAAWSPYLRWLRNVSRSTGKPVMATELGYQSRPRSYVSPAGAARFNPGDCSVYLVCARLGQEHAHSAKRKRKRTGFTAPSSSGARSGWGGPGRRAGRVTGWVAFFPTTSLALSSRIVAGWPG